MTDTPKALPFLDEHDCLWDFPGLGRSLHEMAEQLFREGGSVTRANALRAWGDDLLAGRPLRRLPSPPSVEDLQRERDLMLTDRDLWKEQHDALRSLAADLVEGLAAFTSIMEHCTVEAGCCMCGDSMEPHPSPMLCGHSPVDMGQHHADEAYKIAQALLTRAAALGVGKQDGGMTTMDEAGGVPARVWTDPLLPPLLPKDGEKEKGR